ncbi:MAG: NAD(P)H-dependent oxidoreductase [Bacteroidota bacterium]
MIKLKLIFASVREGRKGISIAEWVKEVVSKDPRFETEYIDLKEWNLPMMNEPEHPRFQKYKHEHSKKWSATIAEGEAFIFVTPEYDFGYPGVLRNALEYLFFEWAYKPAGIVTYGGVSAGTRSANALKNDLASLKVPALSEMVNIPMFTQFIKEDGKFHPNEVMEKAIQTLLTELARWSKGMTVIRENK